MEVRRCKTCSQEKTLDLFPLRISFDGSKKTLRWDCKICYNAKTQKNKKNKDCLIENCANVVSAKNMCSKHYKENFHPNANWYKKYWASEKGKLLSINNRNRRRDSYTRCDNFSKENKEFYKNKPTGYSVDHIIPIKNKDVCGLHVPWNLQYITKSENSQKRNKFDFTYDNNSWRQDIIINLNKVA
jgi:hypothetical protein